MSHECSKSVTLVAFPSRFNILKEPVLEGLLFAQIRFWSTCGVLKKFY